MVKQDMKLVGAREGLDRGTRLAVAKFDEIVISRACETRWMLKAFSSDPRTIPVVWRS